MRSKLNILLGVITTIIAYLFQSATEKKLLFLDGIIDPNFNKSVFDHPLRVLIILLILYGLVWLWIYFREKDQILINTGYRVCEYIFKQVEKEIDSTFRCNIRVTLFKASNPFSENTTLTYLSRFQVRKPFKTPKIRFSPGVGCAGVCFETQSPIFSSTIEYSEATKKQYFTEMKNKYNVDPEILEKINTKSCTFLGIPIKCHNTGQTWGVLLIDSTKPFEKLERISRKIEEIANHYTPFFTEVSK